jgi:centromeric protein E
LLCSENPIDLREKDGTVYPVPVEHIDILSGEDIIEAAKRLQRERRLGETRMNKQSSRSHTILRMTINNLEEDTSVEDSESSKRIISAVLNFVDLAGSEKASQTGATGDRLREAGHINTSLSALSKVVNQLSRQWEVENKRESSSIVSSICQSIEPRAPKSRMPVNNSFVSYRDSKLTRLLQSSLAGDALIAIICNATPASCEETLTTLR